jgi:tetratricopeptide (TPR) repeat protein
MFRVCSPVVLILTAGVVFAAADPAPPAKPKNDQERLVDEVMQQLVRHLDPIPGTDGPVEWRVIQTIDGDEHNAVASIPWRADGKRIPLIRITYGYLEVVVNGDADLLALVLGHELGHHVRGHTARELVAKPRLRSRTDSQKREYEADEYGARLMRKAGFNLDKAIAADHRGNERMRALLSAKHHRPIPIQSTLGGIRATHPCWIDRYMRMIALESGDRPMPWACLSAFQSGVDLLAVEQFEAAELSFERVVRDFPNCYEAWVNLGIARLMQYCRTLSPEDLRALGVGPLVGVGFYRQAGTLVTRGGGQEKLWEAACQALKRALDLKPDLTLAHANLGLAYLVHPAGPAAFIGEAHQHLQLAIDGLAAEDASLDPTARVVVTLNLGVARLVRGDRSGGMKLLADAVRICDGLWWDRQLQVQVARAATFHNAHARAAAGAPEDRTEAARLFETFLRTTDPASAWWPAALEQYRAVCQALGLPAKTETELRPIRRDLPLPIRSVTLASGAVLALGETVEEVLHRLGPAEASEALSGTGLRRLRFATHGIELLADETHVIAIYVTGPTVPGLRLQLPGVGSGTAGELKVGMSRRETEPRLGGIGVHRPLTGFGDLYHYYRHLGVAIRYDRPGPDGVVVELVLVMIPDGDFDPDATGWVS